MVLPANFTAESASLGLQPNSVWLLAKLFLAFCLDRPLELIYARIQCMGALY